MRARHLAPLALVALGACTTHVPATPHVPDAGPLAFDSGQPPLLDSGRVFTDAGSHVDAAGFLEGTLGATVVAADPLPPISGGTLFVTHDDHWAIAADPERDRVLVVDLGTHAVDSIALPAHAEPGRVAEDAAGRVHVVLRGAGAIATIDPSTHALLSQRAICTAPRGIAYEAATDLLHVACRDGELVSIAPAADTASRRLTLPDDLRDVLVVGDRLFVSRFRAAEVLVIDAAGALVQQISLPDTSPAMVPTEAAVAWRMIVVPTGVWLLHQRGSLAVLDPSMPSAYGGGFCERAAGVVELDVTPISSTGTVGLSTRLACVPLGVDIALAPDGVRAMVATPGSTSPPASRLAQVMQFQASDLGAVSDAFGSAALAASSVHERAVAVAYTSAGSLVVQVREPAHLAIFDPAGVEHDIDLGGASRADTGWAVFHSDPGAGLACASCHPEGGDDGRVWQFAGFGARRTQSIRGGILATAPFHWDGEETTFAVLVNDVLSHRMGGGPLSPEHTDALGHWVDALPAPIAPPAADPAAVDRGRALFESPAIGCASCHSGATLTNDTSVDVGTGGVFQVPSLRGVFARAPYMHDGCAPSLAARFTSTTCGGGDRHGVTSTLTGAQIADLVAYLETL